MRSNEFVVESFVLSCSSLDELEWKLSTVTSSCDSFDVVDVSTGGISFIDGKYLLPVSIKKEMIIIRTSPR